MGAIIDKVKGKMKKAEGRMTGDKVRTAQGHIEEKKGKAKSAMRKAKRKVKAKTSQAKVRGRMAKSKAKRKAKAARYTP